MERSKRIREQARRRKRQISKKITKFVDNVENRRIRVIREDIHSNSENGKGTASLEERLRLWSHKHNITRMAMNDLLHILIFFGFSMLPKDARTLMLTPRNIEVNEVANGRLWFNGVEHNIRRIFRTLQEDLTLFLNFNIDGIPLFNSSKTEFWPILGNIHGKTIHLKKNKAF